MKIIIIAIVIIVLGFLGYNAFLKTEKPKPVTVTEIVPNSKDSIITISNFSFQPEQLTIKSGKEVIFKNEDSVTHTVTGEDFDSGNIESGGTYKHTFTKKGSINYHCTPHPSMKGIIIVE